VLADLGEQLVEGVAVAVPQVGVVLEDVEFVGRGDVEESAEVFSGRNDVGAGEAVPELRLLIGAEAGISRLAIATRVEVDEGFGAGADQVDEGGTVAEVEGYAPVSCGSHG
jgi:hypothetical protein